MAGAGTGYYCAEEFVLVLLGGGEGVGGGLTTTIAPVRLGWWRWRKSYALFN